MNERQANFANGLILSFYWAFNVADVPVNDKGEHLVFKFNTQSNRFCFKGNIL
ncbi:hypothetical protein MIS45_06910 [Wielerella bovis]|uniref:hypothetical protein n=1 Tax=Wielerella bovis TaxID=2917790 RepID=UPI002018DC04|nr:hypothetical protein [Wielerella bovis]ULJ61769.1 hypothetical protein MIS46_07100 [Wielerella bovis]ULJ68533.1 hypothetical protein MIS45_06910 [Wielerella bovis]